MKKEQNIFRKIFNGVKRHKWQTFACTAAVVLLIGAGGFAISNNMQAQQIANSQKALELAAQKGGITDEQLQELQDNGGFAAFGTELTDPTTGETVVLTQDEQGNIVKTVVADVDGNSTGAAVPEDHSNEFNSERYELSSGGNNYGESSSGGGNESGGGSSSGSGSSTPAPTPTSAHSHIWVAHTATRTVQTGSNYVVDVPAQDEVWDLVLVKEHGTYCNQCGIRFPDVEFMIEHVHEYQHGGSHWEPDQCEYRCVKEAVPEQGHYEPVYGQEQYIDYYYCSDCGIRQ